MGRRKRYLDDGSDSDSSADKEDFDITDRDLEEEAEYFVDPNKRRTRRRFTKDDAIYGIFKGSSDEDEDGSNRRYHRKEKSKDIQFVAGSSTSKEAADVDENQMDVVSDDMSSDESAESEGDIKSDGDEMDEDDVAETNRRRRPVVREDDEDELNSFGHMGLGMNQRQDFNSLGATSQPQFLQKNQTDASGTRPSFSSSTGSKAASSSTLEELQNMTFASTKDKRKLNDTSVSSKSEPPSKSFSELKQNFKVDKEFAKFEKHTKGIGLKLLMKMGYKPGQGLGSEGAGIVKPIEVMQRPKGMGLAYKDFKEKTKQAKEEELRRKEQEGTIDETEMDELDKISGKGKKAVPRPKTGGWKKSAAKKKKVQYKTAIEVMADVSNAPEAPAQSMKIIDMTGPEARVLSSANQVKSSEQLFYDTSARLPELRHNLRLLVGMAQADLEQTARQQRLDTARLQELNQTVGSLQRNVQNEEAALKRLSEVSQLTKDFQRKMKIMGGSMDFDDLANDASIDEFFTKLITNYYDEYRKYKLDALVVAVIAPLVKRLFADWNALEEPERGLAFFEKWRKLLSSALPRSAMESIDPVTTPYESLIYHIWLPRIRSAINSSDFNIRNPSSAIHLLDIWYPTHLPPFVYVNIIDQLILPKITDAVNSWNPRKDPTPIHTWIHPWLPHLDNRLTTLYPSIRHKIGILLDSWHPSQTNMMSIISPWSTIFSSSDFNILLTKSIIPKLQVTLHTELSINPAHQILDPLNWTIEWLPLLGIQQTSRLLETEFVPKWLNVLYLWLTSPNPNFDEITTWYMTWKQYFPPDLIDSTVSTGLARGFKMGLDLMNQALAGIKIQPPVFIPSTSSISEPSITPIPSAASQPQRPQHEPAITFKDLLTHLAESNGLMFMSTTKTHEKSGKYLWKLVNSENRGVLVYLEDEVAFIKNENGEWAPIGVDELIEQVLRM